MGSVKEFVRDKAAYATPCGITKARAGSLVCFTAILISGMPLTGSTIISVTAPPGLSTGIGVLSVSWSEAMAYNNATITALVDSFIVGQTPTADAYLTTQIGPGTTTTDEIARAQFVVPLNMPVCSPNSCGADVTLFSGLSLGPGTYFVTIGPDPASIGTVGWFPALNPTVITDTGVTEGPSFFASIAASYAPASGFTVCPFAMNFNVVAVPEPSSVILTLAGVSILAVLRPRGLR